MPPDSAFFGTEAVTAHCLYSTPAGLSYPQAVRLFRSFAVPGNSGQKELID